MRFDGLVADGDGLWLGRGYGFAGQVRGLSGKQPMECIFRGCSACKWIRSRVARFKRELDEEDSKGLASGSLI